MLNKLYVEWTGSYPNLCSGEWVIKYDGIELTVPDDIKYATMDTFGEYGSWYFDEDMYEVWDYYTDGDDEETWITKNIDWVKSMFEEHGIEVTSELLSTLFKKVQEEDWRHGSCGGCI